DPLIFLAQDAELASNLTALDELQLAALHRAGDIRCRPDEKRLRDSERPFIAAGDIGFIDSRQPFEAALVEDIEEMQRYIGFDVACDPEVIAAAEFAAQREAALDEDTAHLRDHCRYRIGQRKPWQIGDRNLRRANRGTCVIGGHQSKLKPSPRSARHRELSR